MIIKERHLHVRYSRATMHVHSRTPTLSLPFKGIHPFMHWIDLIYKFYICVPVKCSNNNVNLPAEKFSNCTNPSWRNTKKISRRQLLWIPFTSGILSVDIERFIWHYSTLNLCITSTRSSLRFQHRQTYLFWILKT